VVKLWEGAAHEIPAALVALAVKKYVLEGGRAVTT
jgi:hypothetical protein